jgi:hypothetical protein
MRLEGLGKLITSYDLAGNRTRELPAQRKEKTKMKLVG